MVPRRKLINHGAAKLTESGMAETAAPGAHSRSSSLPIAETPISNEPPDRARAAAPPTTATTPASIAKARLKGDEATAAPNKASAEAIAMPNPTCRQRRARREGWRVVHGTSKFSNPLEHQRAIRPAEAERIFHRHVDAHVTRRVGAVVEIALGVLIEDIDRRRRDLMVYCQRGDD